MKRNKLKKAAFVFLPFLLFLVFEIMFYTNGIHLANNPILIIFTVLLFYTISLFVFFIFNNSKISNIIISIVGFILMFISNAKIAFSDEPLFLSDIFYLNDTGELFDIVDQSFWSTLRPIILISLIFIVALVGLNILSFKCEFKLKSRVKRFVGLGITAALLLLVFIPNKSVDTFILRNIYRVNSRLDYEAISSKLGYYRTYGHLGGLYGSLLENRVFQSDDYDEILINEALKNAPEEKNKALKKPNIIVVFSEAFWDIDQLSEVEFDKPVTSNFNKLKEEGLFFDMVSPSFGGISANVEFEFLTGASLNYFGIGYVPYMDLYNVDKSNSPSIINELNNNDYYTKIVLFTSPDLFNCNRFYSNSKPDHVDYLDDVDDSNKKGDYVSDEYMTDLIINAFDNKGDEKLFYFTESMQAHLPYYIHKYDKYDVKVTKSNLSENLTGSIQSYAQGAYDADKQLGRLYDYIKTLDEETIIVFYGDHLPYIHYDKEKALEELEFFNTEDKKLNTFRQYNTQALVLANFDIKSLQKENKKELKYLGPDLLSAYLLNHMDINISDYYKWLYSTRNIIGASNKYVSVDQQGNLYYTQELTDDMKRINDLRNNIQYKYFIK